MGNMKEYFNDLNHHKKQLAAKRLDEFDPTDWTCHTSYHYSQQIDGTRLDYYPTTDICKWKGKTIKPAKPFIQELLKNHPTT